MNIQVRGFWSIYAGKYSVWYKIYPEDHKLEGISTLETPSMYVDEMPDEGTMHKSKLHFVGFNLQTPDVNLRFLVTQSGKITCLGLWDKE